MRSRVILAAIGVFVLGFLGLGCVPQKPTTLIVGEDAYKIIEIRDDKTYAEAWEAVVDVLCREFDIELLSKENGYIQTGVKPTMQTDFGRLYLVRASVKFSADRKTLGLRVYATFKTSFGYDENVLSTLHNDLSARLGRGIK